MNQKFLTKKLVKPVTFSGHGLTMLKQKAENLPKKLFIFLFALSGLCTCLFGQQEPNFTLYMMNPLVYNPAIAGTHNYYQLRLNSRFQWLGLKDAPITNSFSAYGPHTKKPMGFGGSIYQDITGPTSRTAVNGLYGYNISVSQDIRVSFGLTLGLMQYKIDGTKIKTADPGDPYLLSRVYSSMAPDASAGVYVWSPSLGFYGGFSGLHLLHIFSKDKNVNVDGIRVLNTHFYLIAGYLYHIVPRQWTIEPSVIVKKVIPASYQVEFSTKVIYKGILWGGLAYRTQDAFSAVVGYTFDQKFQVGYAFDLALNDVRRYSVGSHEIVIGYNFDPIKKRSTNSKKK